MRPDGRQKSIGSYPHADVTNEETQQLTYSMQVLSYFNPNVEYAGQQSDKWAGPSEAQQLSMPKEVATMNEGIRAQKEREEIYTPGTKHIQAQEMEESYNVTEGPTEIDSDQLGFTPMVQDADQVGTDEDGPPPGFEGPPQYKTPPRESQRIKNKNTGKYISAIDRARINRGFLSTVDLMQKPKSKPKKTAKPTMEYLQDYGPLREEHAQVIAAAAGVDINQQLLKQIEEAGRVITAGDAQPTVN